MSILKTALVTSALIFGGATPVFAQDAMTDKAKDMAIDKGVDMAKDKAVGAVGDSSAKYADPAAKAGKDMLKGASAKDAAMGAVTSQGTSMTEGITAGGITDTSLNQDEAMTAGKVIMKGGSTEDAAMAVAKERAKSQLMDKAEGLVTQTVAEETIVTGDAVIDSTTVVTTDPSGTVAPVAATVTKVVTPAQPQLAINCPSGTTAQPNGTCMITGDYK